MIINSLPSPNFDERPVNTDINILVMHYTGMQTAQEALDRLCDSQSSVSSHYLIDDNGKIFSLVHEDMRAWHAGISCWRGRAALNDTSIGIELSNPGHEFGYREFPDVQIQSLINLSLDIVNRYDIEARNVVGHSDIAPFRKQDPGELFNWKLLAENNIGLWPNCKKPIRAHSPLLTPGEESVSVSEVQRRLSEYGYHIRIDGFYGPKTEAIIKGFKRHFVQDKVNVVWDKMSNVVIDRLLDLC